MSSTKTWSNAIEEYLRDQRHAGRINSEETVRTVRRVLKLHTQDTIPVGPIEASREDVKRTLARWEHPNTRAREHAVLNSFYDWTMTEGYRQDNPARQVARPKMRKPMVYRLTRAEVVAMIAACETQRERWLVLLGVCTGARVGELMGFQGRHFEREGFVWFSPDITKGKTERWTPVLPELEPVVEEIRASVPAGHYLFPGYPHARWPHGDPDPTKRIAHSTFGRVLVSIARRAGITAHIHPHLLRHAYGDHVAKHAGLHAAQALMGHASVSTTASTYVDRPGLDELSASVRGLRYGEGATATVHADVKPPVMQAPPKVRAEGELTPFAEVLADARAAAPLRPVGTLAELQAVVGGRSIAPEVIQQLALVDRAHAEGAELEAITTLDVATLAGGRAR